MSGPRVVAKSCSDFGASRWSPENGTDVASLNVAVHLMIAVALCVVSRFVRSVFAWCRPVCPHSSTARAGRARLCGSMSLERYASLSGGGSGPRLRSRRKRRRSPLVSPQCPWRTPCRGFLLSSVQPVNSATFFGHELSSKFKYNGALDAGTMLL